MGKQSSSRIIEQGPLFTIVREMVSDAPAVETPADVDIAELQRILGEDLEFVTLPIGQVDVVSRNGHKFARSSIEEMVRQVNEKRPEGMWGHYNEWEIGYKYETPAVRWIAAYLDDEGVAWGKAVPLTEESKKHFLLAKATGAKVGSSIYGTDVAWNEDEEIVYYRLITIDLSNPERVGVPMTAAQPQLARQMFDPNIKETDTVDPLKDKDKEQPENLLQETIDRQRSEIRELRLKEGTLNRIAQLFEVAPEDDILETVQNYIHDSESMAAENRVLLDGAIDTMISEKVKVEAPRDLIKELVSAKKPATKRQVEKALTEVLDRPSIKNLLKDIVEEESGPPNHPSTNNPLGTEAWKQFVDIPEDN